MYIRLWNRFPDHEFRGSVWNQVRLTLPMFVQVSYIRVTNAVSTHEFSQLTTCVHLVV
jgi:hypothetical protein